MIYGPEDAERWLADFRRDDCEDNEFCNNEYILRQTAQLPGIEGDFWRPDIEDIHAFKKLLKSELKKGNPNNTWDPPGPLREYVVQYIGYEKDGRRLIYARGLQCHNHNRCNVDENWPLVSDGGSSIFHASFDPESRSILGVGFNGYA